MPAAGRRPRTLYSNDSRHYHLFVHEPPMTLADARRPVDDVAGTAVDTFVFMVARGDGLFYPSKVGGMFGSDATTAETEPPSSPLLLAKISVGTTKDGGST